MRMAIKINKRWIGCCFLKHEEWGIESKTAGIEQQDRIFARMQRYIGGCIRYIDTPHKDAEVIHD